MSAADDKQAAVDAAYDLEGEAAQYINANNHSSDFTAILRINSQQYPDMFDRKVSGPETTIMARVSELPGPQRGCHIRIAGTVYAIDAVEPRNAVEHRIIVR